jgi:NAD(P)H-hydrate epimerase
MNLAAELVFLPDAVRALDRCAIERHGIPGYTLMQRAALASLLAIRARWPERRRWLVCCGAGNNAGDGYVLARLARAEGIEVTVIALADPARLSGDAASAWRDFHAQGGRLVQLSEAPFAAADLAVDALFGTGLSRAPGGAWLRAIELLNGFGGTRPVVALDVPSGLDAGSGAVPGAAVAAALTVSFVGHKLGLYVGRGPDLAGEIEFSSLEVPAAAYHEAAPVARLVTPALAGGLLRPRPRTAHKGLFGHVLLVGGNHGMGGAVRLAGEAALRSGAGLVSIATRTAHAAALTAARPELMIHAVEEPGALGPLLARAGIVAIGPGLGQDGWARSLLAEVLAHDLRCVVDADALNLLASAPQPRDNWVLTPHPGEAARLLGETAGQVQQDRLAALEQLVGRYRGVILLKGRATLVGRDGNLPLVLDGGNPGMASAGMGDVLTGIVAGLLAQYPAADPQAVAACAAWAHATAADQAMAALGGPRGLLAGDLPGRLPSCLNPSR